MSFGAVSEYSNSTPNMSSDSPTPNPRTWRLEGVAFVPTKAVRSASAVVAAPRETTSRHNVKTSTRNARWVKVARLSRISFSEFLPQATSIPFVGHVGLLPLLCLVWQGDEASSSRSRNANGTSFRSRQAQQYSCHDSRVLGRQFLISLQALMVLTRAWAANYCQVEELLWLVKLKHLVPLSVKLSVWLQRSKVWIQEHE